MPDNTKGETDVQKAKVALVEAGIIKTAGRGRISADGHAWLKARYDEGERFSDWPKGNVVVTKTEHPDKPAESTVKVIRTAGSGTEKTIADIPPYRFTEEEFMAVEKGTNTERSLRSACNNCRVSLVMCYCPNPMIVKRDGSGSVEVTIKRK